MLGSKRRLLVVAEACCLVLLLWGWTLRNDRSLAPSVFTPTLSNLGRLNPDSLEFAEPFRDGYVDPSAASTLTPFELEKRQPWYSGSRWNPYVGSGFPIHLDGHSSFFSPYRALRVWIGGEQGHDVVIVLRLFLSVSLFALLLLELGVGAWIRIPVLLAVASAPYAASFVDMPFLDVDLLAPLIPLALLGLQRWRRATRLIAAAAIGLLVAVLGWHQSQVVFLAVTALWALCLPSGNLRDRLGLAAAVFVGFAASFPLWSELPLALSNFVSARAAGASCLAAFGLGWGWLRDLCLRVWEGHNTPAACFSAAGVWLLLSTPFERRWRWLLPFAVLLSLIVVALPEWVCLVPGVSGVRFWRHLAPHAYIAFLLTCALAMQARLNARRLDWLFLVGLLLAAASGAFSVPLGPTRILFFLGCALLAFVRFAPRLVGSALLTTWVLAPLLFLSRFPWQAFGAAGQGPELRFLPDAQHAAGHALLDLGQLSRSQDRRHFSFEPQLEANMSAAFGILDLRVLAALYPRYLHELNSSLTNQWRRDVGQALNPDRFVGLVGDPFSAGAQRLYALHRVSLFTVAQGGMKRLPPTGLYSRPTCQLRKSQGVLETWICPHVGGIAYFPSRIEVLNDAEAIQRLRHASPAELLHLAILSDESNVTTNVAGRGRILSVERQASELRYQLDVEQAGIFVIAETWFPGWRAWIDGKELPIQRANVAFKAIHLPETGRHELRLRY